MNDGEKQMWKIILGSIALTTMLFFSHCGDEIPNLKLPDKSTAGLNTFGCLVDNSVWTNYGTACFTFGCADSNLRGNLTKTMDGKHEFYIWADYTVRSKRLFQSINIIVPDLTGVGDFDLPDENMVFIADDQSTIYENFGPGNGLVKITRYDTINSIISGEFSGILTLTNGTKTIEITEGRFDITIN